MMLRILSLLIFLILAACVDPLAVDIGDIEPKVAIEGLVGDQPGMSFINISTTSNIQGVGSNLLGTGALVQVLDSQGLTHSFSESTPGKYFPADPGFTGIVGVFYTLEVTTNDGEQYISSSQLLPMSVPIDGISVEFEELIDPDTKVKTGAHNVLVDVPNDGSQDFFFRTFTRGIAHVFSDPGGDCGGCEECWDFRIPVNNQIYAGSNQGLDQGFTIETAAIPYDFRDEYFVETTVFSLTAEGYDFWSSIQDQLQITGTIFDPQIVSVRGNISNRNSTGPQAFGYFGASATNKCSLVFNRTLTNTTIPILELIPGVCVDVYPNAVGTKPEEFN